uniref:Arrestin C-terminal-like domain-containing protein n=1 Tax=Stomoxys calcitrans TaxID=35570 RepID=A0A1I8P8K7_STOCA
MSLLSCFLRFESAQESYRPGEVIKGTVTLNVHGSSTLLIKALSIKCSGYASCQWEKPQTAKKESKKPKPKEFYVSREDYISTQSYIIGSEQANPSALSPGTHIYSFMVQLPSNAPSSFDGALGFIRYELQVNANYIDRIDCLTSTPLMVEQSKDLRRLAADIQTATENEKYEAKPCLKFWRRPLQLYVSLPQSGYVVGECISVHVKVSNHGNVKLKDITTKLNRIVTYKGAIKERKPMETSETTAIACNVHGLFGQNSNVTQHLQQLFVPKTSPSLDATECKCLSVRYEVEVTVCARNAKRFVQTVVPIVVGTVSLSSDEKLPVLNTATNHAATITVARSMDELNLPSTWEMRRDNVTALQQAAQLSASTSSLGK